MSTSSLAVRVRFLSQRSLCSWIVLLGPGKALMVAVTRGRCRDTRPEQAYNNNNCTLKKMLFTCFSRLKWSLPKMMTLQVMGDKVNSPCTTCVLRFSRNSYTVLDKSGGYLPSFQSFLYGNLSLCFVARQDFVIKDLHQYRDS